MSRVDINSLMQQALHAANNRLDIQTAVAKAPASAPLPDVGAAGVAAVSKATEEVKLLTTEDILLKATQQAEAINTGAAQLGAAMQGAKQKATGGSQ